MKKMIFLLLFAVLCSGVNTAFAQTRLSAAQAEKLITFKPKPIYPPIVAMMEAEAVIKVEVTVNAKGLVRNTKFIDGSPSLLIAGLETAQKYRFKPYMVKGKPTPFITTVEIIFSQGSSKQEIISEQAAGQNFITVHYKCIDLLNAQKWKEAEPLCRSAVKLGEQLPDKDTKEKVKAYESLAFALFSQELYQDALEYYTRAYETGRTVFTASDAETAKAYFNLGRANQGLGKVETARDFYVKAEKTYRTAYDLIAIFGESERLRECRNGIRKSLLLQQYIATYLRDEQTAKEIEKRLSELPQK